MGSDGRPTNTITQALGQNGDVVPHIATDRLIPGVYLLCSDGVSGLQNPAQLRAAMLDADAKVAVAAIAAAVREAGAHDNYTLALIEVLDVGAEAITVERPIASAEMNPR
jgi:PPM family protein phosphatase